VKPDEKAKILTSGLRAAHKRLFSQDGPGDWNPPDGGLMGLYSELEDALYSLYSAIQQKQARKALRDAGDIIVRASMAAELAEEAIDKAGKGEKK
jgi:hypothetical protein